MTDTTLKEDFLQAIMRQTRVNDERGVVMLPTQAFNDLFDYARGISNSPDAKDAARWRKFCGLMAYGDFVVQSTQDGDAVEVIDYIEELCRAVDGGSDAAAKVGREDDASNWRKLPHE